jgi:pectin methylesterase-like acyl-CoA thioesterase
MLTMTVVLAAHPTLAASYAVGTCKPTLPSFANISAAVSSVPPSSTVLVCPGTYKEQVTISQPLTLQGITSANSARAVIAVPDGA